MNNKKFDQLEAEELDAITLDILIDNNLKKAQAEDLMKTFDREKKILVCQQHGKRMETHPNDTALSYCIRLKKLLNSTDDPKELLLSLRVSLSSQNVNWIEEFGSAGGFHLLVQTMDRLMQQIEKVRFDPEQVHREDEIVNCLLELIKSTRTCLNCQPGVKFLFLPNSQLCFKLIEILYVASAAKFDDNSQNLYMQLIVKVLQLLAAISFLGRNGNDDNDMTGNSLLIRDLSIAAERRNVSRFACIVRCFHFNDSETTYRALNVINTLLSNVDDGEWQIRMIWRSELMASGLKALLPSIENLASTDERINTAYNSFIGERKADYEELLGHSEELSKDIESPQDCFNMLVATCKNTDCDELLQDIFVRLLMVDDRKYKRFTYFAMIRMCLSEIVFGDMGNGPEFGRQIVFSTPIEEALKEIESNHKNSRMGTLLESAISAKQDAISLQLKYYEKILEFQTECDSLRKFIESHGQDGSVQGVLPSKTLCDLPAPSGISGTSCSTSQVPPAPPPPPPSLLGKSGGGPPPPPPPPPGLLKSNSAKGPPAPPPPPPGLLNSKAGVPPAPPISIKASPEVPSFLKRKLSRAPEVPMKKIPWNSVLIHPSKLTSNSLWAQLDDAEIASDDVFEGLKANFSSKNPVAALNAPNKIQNKGKESVVIQDAKVLQRLAILQGSCKIGLNRWRSAILSIDEKVLNANLLSQLIGAIPSSEVINKLRECTEEEVKKMPEGEQFVAILSAIPALPIRLEAIQLKFSWAETYTELKNSVTTIAEACDEIFTSNGLKNFINLVLLTGNFMARSKNTKDAFAFELSALSKLADTKSVDNSDTLLNFLIGVFDAKYKGKFTNFVDEFHHVLKATRIDLMETTKNKNTLAGSFRKVSNYLANYKKQCEIDNFHEKIGAFIETAQKDLNSLDRLWEHMNKKWEALQTYLCFDPKKYPMEKLFADLKTFIELYQRALRAILASKNKAEQKKNAENAKRKPLKGLQPMADAINQAKNQRGKIVSEDSGVIDRIEMMLEQGKYRPYNRSAPGTSYRVRRKGNTTLHVTQGENIEKPCNKVANYEPSSETNAEEVDANRKLKDYNQPQSKGVPSAIELLTRLNNL